MSTTFSCNNSPATGPDAMWDMIANLVAGTNWAVQSDSDGTTYASGGGQVTGGGTGTNGLGNTGAWIRISNATGIVVNSITTFREITIQCESGGASPHWRIKYSRGAGFVGGTPGATHTPSATDEQILAGGGTDAAPTYTQCLPADGTYYFSTMVGDASVGFSFLYITHTIGVATYNYSMFFETLQSGMYPAADRDPTMVFPPDATAGDLAVGSTAWKTWLGATPTWISVKPCAVHDGTVVVVPNGSGNNSVTGKADAVPIFWIRSSSLSAPIGWKGISNFVNWSASAVLTNLTPLTQSTTNDRMYWQGLIVPWDGSTPLL